MSCKISYSFKEKTWHDRPFYKVVKFIEKYFKKHLDNEIFIFNLLNNKIFEEDLNNKFYWLLTSEFSYQYKYIANFYIIILVYVDGQLMKICFKFDDLLQPHKLFKEYHTYDFSISENFLEEYLDNLKEYTYLDIEKIESSMKINYNRFEFKNKYLNILIL